MGQRIDKPSDATAVASSDASKSTESRSNNLLDIMDGAKKNALAPAINSFAVEPINTGVNVINGISSGGTWAINKIAGTDYVAPQAGKLAGMEVDKAEHGSAASYSQEIFGTAGSFLVYAVAGKVAGKVLRSAGELTPLELEIKNLKVGQVTRAIAQDSRVATVLGATAYAGLKDTKEGESHFSNAASTFVSFSAFEAGNSGFVDKRAGGLMKLGQRYTVGSLGGVLGVQTSSLIQNHKLADKDTTAAAGLSGGLLNALMPTGKAIADKAETAVLRVKPHVNDAAAKLHIEAVRELPKGQAPEPGSWSDPNAIKSVERAARADLHTRISVDEPGQTRINQKDNVVHKAAGADPLDVFQEMEHRRIFKLAKYEDAFQAQGKQLASTDPADVRNQSVKDKYVETRLDQEIEARTSQNLEAEKLGAARRVSVDRATIRDHEGYGDRFKAEADKFVESDGKFRPEVDHAGEAPWNYQARRVGSNVEHTFNNAKTAGRDHNNFGQTDGAQVAFSFENTGPVRVSFTGGRVHSVNIGEPITKVHITERPDGKFDYRFNDKKLVQLTVENAYQEMKVVATNGDKILITSVDKTGAELPFADGSKMTLTGSGRLTVTQPGAATQTVELGTVPARLAIVESPNGSKLFQLADESALKMVKLATPPLRVVPTHPPYRPPGATGKPPIVSTRVPLRNIPRIDKPSQIQGGSHGTPADQSYYESSFPETPQTPDDRYPFQLNIFHDPARYIEGVDQRALPDREHLDVQDVLIAQQGHYYALENHFANLGRHQTEDPNNFWPW